MNIRTLIYGSMLLLGIALTVFIGLLFSLYSGVDRSGKSSAASSQIVRKVTTLRGISFEYMLHPSERARVQWERIFSTLEADIGSYPHVPSERAKIAQIRQSYRDYRTLYGQMNAIMQGATDPAFLPPEAQESLRHLAGQVLIQYRGW